MPNRRRNVENYGQMRLEQNIDLIRDKKKGNDEDSKTFQIFTVCKTLESRSCCKLLIQQNYKSSYQ